MTTKHTPGPWKHDAQFDTVSSHHPDHRFSLICKLATGEDRAEENANADLICAAPDLLEALEAALPQIQRFRCTDPNGETCDNPVLQQALAAVTKAKGE